MAAGRAWIERERARIEIAADAFALAAGVPQPVLASALVKLSSGTRWPSLPGFATAADLQVRVLAGESTGLEPGAPSSLGPTLAGLGLVFACLLFAVRYIRPGLSSHSCSGP